MPPIPRPTDAEFRLLDELWKGGPLTVRSLAQHLYGEPSAVQYRTVRVQLGRLEKKGLVRCDAAETPHRFAAIVDRGRFIGDQLQSMANEVCDGSLTPLLLNLAGRTSLTENEKDELRRLLGEEECTDE